MLYITHTDTEWQPQYFAIIVGLFCSLYMITLAINTKIITFHGLTMPAGMIVFPLCIVLTDVLTEIYGFNRTRQAIWTAVGSAMLFAMFTRIAIELSPADFWEHQQDFRNVFDLSWRLCVAGAAAWLVGEFSSSYILSRMKLAQNGEYMPARFVVSTMVGQFFDSATFMLVAFIGLMAWHKLAWMTVTTWCVKLVYEIVFLPVSIFITHRIKRLEGVDHFDKQHLRII